MPDQRFVQSYSHQLTRQAHAAGLMHVGMAERHQQTLVSRGREVVSFTNCSYLGLDTDREMIAGAKEALDKWGLHYCCARSRFSLGDLFELEEDLSDFFGARAITFPSVTSAHNSCLPLLASGLLIPGGPRPGGMRLVFDRYAHASMQSLKPIAKDAAALWQMNQHEEFVRYTHVTPLASLAEAENKIRSDLTKFQRTGFPDPLGVYCKDDPQTLIGSVGCFKPLAGLPQMDLAFDIAPEHWGRGYAGEACAAMIDFTMAHFPIHRLQARCATENKNSRRVLEKLGMRFEGTLKNVMFFAGRPWDMDYFALTYDDWRQCR